MKGGGFGGSTGLIVDKVGQTGNLFEPGKLLGWG